MFLAFPRALSTWQRWRAIRRIRGEAVQRLIHLARHHHAIVEHAKARLSLGTALLRVMWVRWIVSRGHQSLHVATFVNDLAILIRIAVLPQVNRPFADRASEGFAGATGLGHINLVSLVH